MCISRQSRYRTSVCSNVRAISHVCMHVTTCGPHRAGVSSDGNHYCNIFVLLSCYQVSWWSTIKQGEMVEHDASSTSQMSPIILCAVQGCWIASHRTSTVVAVHRNMVLIQAEHGARRLSLPGKHGLTTPALPSLVILLSIQGRLIESLRAASLHCTCACRDLDSQTCRSLGWQP